MLKFFRKIRRKLIEDGNLRSYILYAIGEILLVMIGILLALQVNNWNENRKAKKEELVALKDLLNEFQRNKSEFQLHAKYQNSMESLWTDYLAIITNEELPDSIRAQKRPLMAFRTFTIANIKLNSLLATGYIDRIQNDSLKHLLLEWNDILLDYQIIEQDHVIHAKQSLAPIELRLKPNEIAQEIIGMKKTFYSPQEQMLITIRALENMEYQNSLISNHYWLKLKVAQHEYIIKHLNDVIVQLRISLNENFSLNTK